MGGPCYGGCSSGEEDGDAEWRAAIDSVATTSSFISSFTEGFLATSNLSRKTATRDIVEDFEHKHGAQLPKHYQVKAQKLLDDILDKTLEIVSDLIHTPNDDSRTNEGGVRLFKHAPLGIVFDQVDELQGPTKRPRIIPGQEINEKSKKFKRRLQSVAVDGEDIIATAKDARLKSLARIEAKEAAAKAAAKREEERVAELKKVRGERWLPSIAREMKLQVKHRA